MPLCDNMSDIVLDISLFCTEYRYRTGVSIQWENRVNDMVQGVYSLRIYSGKERPQGQEQQHNA